MGIDLDDLTAELGERLAEEDAALAARYPGDRGGRQPVHTVYVPADRYTAGLCPDGGARALAAINERDALFADLAGFLLRALHCGAAADAEVRQATGLDRDALADYSSIIR